MRIVLLAIAMTAATCNQPEPKPVPIDSGDASTPVVDAGATKCTHPGSACCTACEKMSGCVEGQASPNGVSCETVCETNSVSVIASDWLPMVRCVNLAVSKSDLQRCGVCR